ncbi:hypothetical protein ACFXG4_44035 [Nocardia sp. NPDC059246]
MSKDKVQQEFPMFRFLLPLTGSWLPPIGTWLPLLVVVVTGSANGVCSSD